MRMRVKFGAWIALSGAVAISCNAITGVEPGQPAPADGGDGFGGQNGQGGAGGDVSSIPCEPGSTVSCYSGEAGTEGFGACHAGVQVCDPDGVGYGECKGEVTPAEEDCLTPVDDDCNGVVNDGALPPVLASPSSGATVTGGSVVLEWTQGAAPYQVEIAFDAAFTDPVTTIPSITTYETSVTVEGLNGGYFYWRVRSLGGCSPSEFTEPAELHMTCKPIVIASDPAISQHSPAIEWNPKDHEYGIVFSRIENGKSKILFLRVDRLGNVAFGPKEIAGPLMPDPSTGGYQGPSIAYVSSVDRWVTAYHREGADQSYVTLFDDAGSVLATQMLDDGFDSEAMTVSFHPDVDQIVTSTDHGGSPWETFVQRFDSSLNPIGPSINAVVSSGSPHDGAFGPSIAVPGLAASAPSLLSVFEFLESTQPAAYQLFLQRIDLTTGALALPKGAGLSAGVKLIPSPSSNKRLGASMGWNPTNQNVGLVYGVKDALSGGMGDAYFTVFNPINGALLSPKTLLNVGAPQKALGGMPKIAWDGEEFLALWTDGRDAAEPGSWRIRMTKFDGTGALIGGGDALYPESSWSHVIPTWTTRPLIGHDRIHTFVSYGLETSMAPHEVWMCIEPPYE